MQTRAHLRIGFYGGTGHGTHVHERVNIAGCWATALDFMNKWIAKDAEYCDDGLTGDLFDLEGAERWTETPETCVNILDMGVDKDADETEDLEDEDSSEEEDSPEEEERA